VELRNSCQYLASRICRVSSAGATAAPAELGGFPGDRNGRRDDPAGVSESRYAPGHLVSGRTGRPAVTTLRAVGEQYPSFSAEPPGGRVDMDDDHG
jgi:hypothetical protein